MKMVYATGKRKSSIAKVFLKYGNGHFYINKKINYFNKSKKAFNIINKPLKVLNTNRHLDINIFVKGGGLTGQAEAIKHGISRALILIEKDESFKKKLKKLGYLTRDSRKVERKKVGRRKARKKEQYSKR